MSDAIAAGARARPLSFAVPGLLRALRKVALFVAVALAFGAAYGQLPLYSSNQNTYLLHGLAKAGYGLLRDDWFASTADPTPLFTELVRASYRALPERAFHVYHALLAGVYLVSIVDIVAGLRRRPHGPEVPWRAVIACAAALFVTNSALLARITPKWGPERAAVLLHSGLAGQYVLGRVFQPSMFGVFLLASIALFLRERPYAAVIAAGVAAAFHPTYALGAVLLGATYAGVLLRRRGIAHAACVAAALAAVLAPTAAYVLVTFRATSPAIQDEARAILAVSRIPHHALPTRWMHPSSWAQIAIVVVALFLVRKTRLFSVLLFPALAAATLTIAQVVTGSHALALAFPWRISVVLVPLSVGIVATAALVPLLRTRIGRPLAALFVVASLAVAIDGALAMRTALARPARSRLAEFVHRSKKPGQVYLVPITTERFRLATGAPIFVDRKSNPYRDVDVVEWNRRVSLARRFYASGDCATLRKLQREHGVTHVVLERAHFRFACTDWEQAYADRREKLMRLLPPGERDR